MWEGLGAATQDESPRLPGCTSAGCQNLMSQAACFSNGRRHLVRLQPGTPGHQSWGVAKFSSKLLFSWIRFQGGRKGRGVCWQMSGEGVRPTHRSRWLGHIRPKKMFWGREGPAGSVEQRCSLTVVGRYTGLALSVLSLHKCSTGRARGWLKQGQQKAYFGSPKVM